MLSKVSFTVSFRDSSKVVSEALSGKDSFSATGKKDCHCLKSPPDFYMCRSFRPRVKKLASLKAGLKTELPLSLVLDIVLLF